MSIRKMIASHPNVAGHVNEPVAQAAKHAMYCHLICTACADACLAEAQGGHGDMTQCIRACLDCADVCGAAARMMVRFAGDDRAGLRAILAACIDMCRICEGECAKHDHDHCRRCAEMCRECADDCRAALATLG